jgi:hypothetical protein
VGALMNGGELPSRRALPFSAMLLKYENSW